VWEVHAGEPPVTGPFAADGRLYLSDAGGRAPCVHGDGRFGDLDVTRDVPGAEPGHQRRRDALFRHGRRVRRRARRRDGKRALANPAARRDRRRRTGVRQRVALRRDPWRRSHRHRPPRPGASFGPATRKVRPRARRRPPTGLPTSVPEPTRRPAPSAPSRHARDDSCGPPTSRCWPSPTIADGVAYTTATTGLLAAVDTATGRTIW
jgi:hypothetical protein